MKCDGIVIGGGPAGMLSAIVASEHGQKVLLIEKNDRLGKKLLITGKGRCNVTNACSSQETMQNIPHNGRFLFSALNAFQPDDIMRFLEEHGCQLKIERGNRVFPVSDKSVSVLDALKRSLAENGVHIIQGRVREILTDNGVAIGVRTEQETVYADWVILATGGMSYPATGSTGDGYSIAQALGHTIIPPVGSLVPLESTNDDCLDMQGLSLRNVGVKLIDEKGNLLYKDFGELLFTHFGVSGPTVLSASAHLRGGNCRVLIDLKPALDEGKLNARVLKDMELYRNRTMENALSDLLPRKMIPVFLRRLNIPEDMQANSLKKEQRREIVALLKAFPIEISGKRPVAEAIITSGGIKVSEIDPKTMESKIVRNLYFAGEIIDCDGYTGGFNLQIAWSTAYAAGTTVKTLIDKQVAL